VLSISRNSRCGVIKWTRLFWVSDHLSLRVWDTRYGSQLSVD
jgi:hypothetical protein